MIHTMDWSKSVNAKAPSLRRVSCGFLELRGESRLAIQMGIGEGVFWVCQMEK